MNTSYKDGSEIPVKIWSRPSGIRTEKAQEGWPDKTHILCDCLPKKNTTKIKLVRKLK
jgi:hypothetical protein